jgi:hypothetical protein
MSNLSSVGRSKKNHLFTSYLEVTVWGKTKNSGQILTPEHKIAFEIEMTSMSLG